MGSSALPLILLLMSLIHSGLTEEKASGSIQETASEEAQDKKALEPSQQTESGNKASEDLPTPTLTVTPNTTVFTGERVNLTCEINSDHDWRYEWNKGSTDNNVMSKESERYTVNGDTLIIQQTITSDQGQYWCRGERDGKSSQSSSAVSLTVKDLPKPTLTVTPDGPVFTGETVNLKCEINSDHSGWRYEWYKGSTDNNGMLKKPEHHTGDTLSIQLTATSDQGPYWCKGHIDGRSVSSQSSSVSLSVKERPKPVVRVQPDGRVFSGETVTLTCDIQETGVWQYNWYKDQDYSRGQDQIYYSTGQDQIYIITSVDQYHAGVYSCRGTQTESPQYSQFSDEVTLTVSDLPTPTLTVTPDRFVFTGERVNLKCEINSDHSDWRYEWNKGSSKLQTSERYTVNRDTLSIVEVVVSDKGQYWCKGHIDGRSVSSRSSSDYLSVSVKDSPTSTLTVTPDRSVFTGETVNLKCEIETYSDWIWRNYQRYDWTHDWTHEWRYEWYKGSRSSVLQKSERYTVNGDTLTISGATESDQGQYWCRGQRDGRPNSSRSSSVSLTVKGLKPKPELTSDSAGAALTGNTVTLTCCMDPSTGYWDFYWYKHTLNPETEKRETNSYRLKIDSVSDGGHYWCRAGRGKPVYYTNYSDALWVNVTAPQSSSLLVIGVSVGLSFFLLFLVSLVLLWRHKNNKDQHRNTQQTSDSNRSGDSHVENSPLQPGSDHIYDDVTAMNSGDKDNTTAESNNVMYTEVGTKVKKFKSKDINTAGPSDLTYAQINIQDKKKSKGKGAGLGDVLIKMKSKEKYKGKSSESGDTLYSELKHNTDRGVDAEVGDETYAQVFKKKGHKNK